MSPPAVLDLGPMKTVVNLGTRATREEPRREQPERLQFRPPMAGEPWGQFRGRTEGGQWAPEWIREDPILRAEPGKLP